MAIGRVLLLVFFVSLASAKVLQFDQREYFNEPDAGQVHWAVIIAGSNGWENYRHQADVCHAYHVLSNHGIPDERIIVLMYDDIAFNAENKIPGKIFNRPNGSDVYHGVPKDYTGENVNVEVFSKILTGEETGVGSGKTLRSGPNDHVFVYFTDHGAVGILGFPNFKEMTATQLQQSIVTAYNKKLYKQLVVYIEACESGSLFEGFSLDEYNAYGTTAANADESSYACYLDNYLDVYLGDVYSVKWMEDSDVENLRTETLLTQYDIVKKETNTSHVQMFGSTKIGGEHVGDFQGKDTGPLIKYEEVPLNAVPSEDVPMEIMRHKIQNAKTEKELREATDKLSQILKDREGIRQEMRAIVQEVIHNEAVTEAFIATRGTRITQRECYETALKDFVRYTAYKDTYTYRYLHALVNVCEMDGVTTSDVRSAIRRICA